MLGLLIIDSRQVWYSYRHKPQVAEREAVPILELKTVAIREDSPLESLKRSESKHCRSAQQLTLASGGQDDTNSSNENVTSLMPPWHHSMGGGYNQPVHPDRRNETVTVTPMRRLQSPEALQ